jgi:type IV secretory pathway VirB2 component (pilin)
MKNADGNVVIKRSSNKRAFALGFMLFALSMAVAAQTASMPWDGPLQIVANALTGPTSMFISTILIVGAGLGIAFSEGQGLKRLMWVIVGAGIAMQAPNLLKLLGVLSV